MTATVVTASLSQRDESGLSLGVQRASSFDGFTIRLQDNGEELVRIHLRDEYGTEDLADALIEAGLTIKRFNEEQEYQEYCELMEEAAQQKERFEREIWNAENDYFTGTREVSFG